MTPVVTRQSTMDEEADYYDEFGNYIGPVNVQSAGDENEDYAEEYDELLATDMEVNVIDSHNSTTTSVVLHEDKKYFPSAVEVYGESVQVLVEEEDAQPLTEPIIAPIKEILVDTQETDIPSLEYSLE